MQRTATKFWVDSIDTCSVPGCTERCVALDIMVANGKRCAWHVPDEWIEQLELNAHELFEKRMPSKIINLKEAIAENKDTMTQEEISAMLSGLPKHEE